MVSWSAGRFVNTRLNVTPVAGWVVFTSFSLSVALTGAASGVGVGDGASAGDAVCGGDEDGVWAAKGCSSGVQPSLVPRQSLAEAVADMAMNNKTSRQAKIPAFDRRSLHDFKI